MKQLLSKFLSKGMATKGKTKVRHAGSGKRVQGRDYADKAEKLKAAGADIPKEGVTSKAPSKGNIAHLKDKIRSMDTIIKEVRAIPISERTGSQKRQLSMALERIEVYKVRLNQHKESAGKASGTPAHLRKQAM